MAWFPIIVPRMAKPETTKTPVARSTFWVVCLGDERVEVFSNQSGAIDRAKVLTEATGKFYSVRMDY